ECAYGGAAVLFSSRPELLARRVALEGYRAPLEHTIKKKDMRDLLTRMWAHEAAQRPSAAECSVALAALLAAVKAKPAPLKAVIRCVSASLPSLAAIRRLSSFSTSPRTPPGDSSPLSAPSPLAALQSTFSSSSSPIEALTRSLSAASRRGSSSPREAIKGSSASSPSSPLEGIKSPSPSPADSPLTVVERSGNLQGCLVHKNP
ncbi:hypothetical protein T484DRAFT_1851964, partial [Baffinella frigidus]